MNQPIPSLKPSAEWVTDLTNKYLFNPNTRTTIQIVLLQTGLTLLSIFIFGWAINYAQQDTITSITNHIHDVVSGATTSAATLPETIEHVRNRTFTVVFIGMGILNALFGYLIAHFALRPARQTLRFQKRFIGNIAHEIRTPLAIIKTSTEVALFDPHLPPDVRDTFNQTIVELDRISDTINNLLSFDSLTSPKAMRFELVDISDIARTVVARHQELAQTRGITLTLRALDGVRVNGNATALDQVLTNLTKNALHYTPAHKDGKVIVEVSTNTAGGAVLTVSDTGIGITQNDIDHVFEPFYRADSSRVRGAGTGSSGLGLTIVSEIMRLHHGTINVKSTVGSGTVVKITFQPPPEASNPQTPEPESDTTFEKNLDFA